MITGMPGKVIFKKLRIQPGQVYGAHITQTEHNSNPA